MRSRISRAADVVQTTLATGLSGYATIELLVCVRRLAARRPTWTQLTRDARRTDLADAVAAARDRYRGRARCRRSSCCPTAATRSSRLAATRQPPACTGSARVCDRSRIAPDGLPDREVTGITAGEPRLDQTSIDLHVTAVTRGFGRAPFHRAAPRERPGDRQPRRVVPLGRGSPVNETFSVSPNPLNPTVYTAEDRRGDRARRSPRTTRAACWSARPAASAASSRSRARRDSSTAS